jgi:hypothetical protein
VGDFQIQFSKIVNLVERLNGPFAGASAARISSAG